MKRYFNMLLLSFLILTLLQGCQNQSEESGITTPSSPIVATVGGKNIYDVDIDYEILSMPESMRHIMQDAGARAKVLDVMIKREVVAQQAKSLGLNRDPLIQYRIHQAENGVMIDSIKEWQNNALKAYSDEQLEAYYKNHLKDFMISAQIHVRHILLSNQQKAADVLKLVKAKPDQFEALAAQYSIDDGNKGRGGDLNWFAKGTMVKAFEDVAFKLNAKRSISQPVKTEFGWHIIQWLGARQQHTPSFEESRDEIIAILEKKRLNTWIQQMMDDADIKVVKSEYRLRH